MIAPFSGKSRWGSFVHIEGAWYEKMASLIWHSLFLAEHDFLSRLRLLSGLDPFIDDWQVMEFSHIICLILLWILQAMLGAQKYPAYAVTSGAMPFHFIEALLILVTKMKEALVILADQS